MPGQGKDGTRLRPVSTVSEQMRAWSAALQSEMLGWPGGTSRSFFGFTALYREDRMFGLLPRTRGMETANAIAFKIESPSTQLKAEMRDDPRIGSSVLKTARWFLFELISDRDLGDALRWLERAYRAAGGGL